MPAGFLDRAAKARQHSADAIGSFEQRIKLLLADVLEAMGEYEERFELLQRSSRRRQLIEKLSGLSAPLSFRDIAGDRDSGPSALRDHPVSFGVRTVGGALVCDDGQIHRELPHFQVSVSSYSHSPRSA
jgi:hypothetical protein